MVLLVYCSKKCSKAINPIGYKAECIGKFKERYPTIPEILLRQEGIDLKTMIWCNTMYFPFKNYRSKFKSYYKKGTLLKFIQTKFAPFFKYDSNWQYQYSPKHSTTDYKQKEEVKVDPIESNYIEPLNQLRGEIGYFVDHYY